MAGISLLATALMLHFGTRLQTVCERPQEATAQSLAPPRNRFAALLPPPLALLARPLRLSGPGKMTCGVALGSVSFAILWVATRGTGAARVAPAWLLAHYLTMTLGEILLAPVGLSKTSKLSPPRWAGVLFGLWYVSTAAGNWLAGSIVRLWVRWPHERFFALLALLLLGVTGVLLSQLGWLRRTLPMHSR